MSDAERRRALLLAALGFALLEIRPAPPALVALKAWLGSWAGIGAVVEGMARQGYDVSLTRYNARGWRATFYVEGTEHSWVTGTGTAWEPTAAQAVQRAAWQALTKGGDGSDA
jgi:hypothetical protein